MNRDETSSRVRLVAPTAWRGRQTVPPGPRENTRLYFYLPPMILTLMTITAPATRARQDGGLKPILKGLEEERLRPHQPHPDHPGYGTADGRTSSDVSEQVDVVFILDGSGSIEPATFELQKQAIVETICGERNTIFAFGRVAVAVIQFSSEAVVEIPLTILDSSEVTEQVCADISFISQLGGGTSLQPALEAAQGIFLYQTQGTILRLFISTDGGVEDEAESLLRCEKQRSMNPGVKICTALASQQCPQEDDFLKNCANTPDAPEHYPDQPAGGYVCMDEMEDYLELASSCTCVILEGEEGDCDGNGILDVCERLTRSWISRLPTPRRDHALARDDARRRVVLFGGTDSEGLNGELWEWDGAAWAQRFVDGPSARAGHAMAYDRRRGVTVLFGGLDARGVNGETWEWDGEEWTLQSREGPSPRAGHAMTYDDARGVTVLFGGADAQALSGQTWEWDGATWTLRAESGPSPRAEHGLAYDPSRQVAVLFGGWTGAYDDQTWEWDGTTWMLKTVGGPSARQEHVLVRDDRLDALVLFGGRDRLGRNGETWQWAGSSWSRVSTTGPSARVGHAGAHDGAGQATLVFGGEDIQGTDNDLWAWSGGAWTRLSGGGVSPRVDHAMAYDETRGVTVLFGGYDQSPDDQTWTWDGAAWTLQSESGPTPRFDHALTHDRRRGVVVLFGGIDPQGRSDETWEWDGAEWSLAARRGPSGRVDHAMAYDPDRGVTVLFGGFDGIRDGQTWEWDGIEWILKATEGPSPRRNHAMVYDERSGVVALFGGSEANRLSGETWEWDGRRWRLQAVDGPAPREDHAMAYDRQRGVTLLFGGMTAEGPSRELWEWNGELKTWTPRNVAEPSARFAHAMTYDARRGVTTLFGGSALDDKTWEWPSGVDWVEILQPPTDQTVRAGETATFTVATVHAECHRWRRDGVSLTDGPTPHGSVITGSHTDALTLTRARLEDQGVYDVVVTDDYEELLSKPATLTVRNAGQPTCDGIDAFNGQCEQNTLKVKIELVDDLYTGRKLTVAVNGVAFKLKVRGDQAKKKFKDRTGVQTLTLIDPPDCDLSRAVDCGE